MTIQLNGEIKEFAEACSVSELLIQIGFAEKPVVVELNTMALLPEQFSTTIVENGAKIEIIAITAGG